MHILVTGGAGYIGSHTVQELLRAGYRVTVLDNLSRGHMAVAQVLDGAEFVWGDIADRELVVGLVRSRGIQAVLHFAALSLVGESMAEPSLYYHNNVVKGLSLLEAAREAEVPCFIFSSTAAVYGEPVQVPIEEDHPLAPTNPYGATWCWWPPPGVSGKSWTGAPLRRRGNHRPHGLGVAPAASRGL
ncbi:UDP-glucose 4-epimerase [Desulfofundulus sp. TPOSR]|uniref:NAD-dependent epimerase/dehydratase family protein n=1 Tax=Desulfofundulus sp. TPOSR TaxID=2714340 RepID=UPI00140AA5DC|nr:NAD-dependent epimerase/dehydratase family protein [Desulfofundulus sp. TPOSR]NHM28258.1 UDP-glucose 4-epimerase [Desulfofundulus sp. TPOSR]